MRIPRAIKNLMEAFERLPGIGSKTAARLTFYLLHVPEDERQALGQSVLELSRGTAICERCFNIANPLPTRFDPGSGNANDPGSYPDVQSRNVLCDVCRDSNRDQNVICVVEDPLDLLALERTGKYKGLYHVLHGAIAPLEHIGPEDLKINELVERLKQGAADSSSRRVGDSKPDGFSSAGPIKEIILATNPSLEGEATAMYIKQLIGKWQMANGKSIKITRIARGIPTGGDLEYADETTLSKALEGRQEY